MEELPQTAEGLQTFFQFFLRVRIYRIPASSSGPRRLWAPPRRFGGAGPWDKIIPMASRAAVCLCALALLVSEGCSASYRRWHESRLLRFYGTPPDPRHAKAKDREFQDRWAPWLEHTLIDMSEDFQVPLDAPVCVYHDAELDSGKSYYNRVTGAIVLRGDLDRAAYVHELSHLLTHRLVRSPPYWSDQALAEYMETRFAGSGSPRERLTGAGRPPPPPPDRVRRLTRHVASSDSPSDLLDHLSRSAVDEERGWGLLVVFYLFEEKWAGDEPGKKIRRLLSLTLSDVESLAPELVEYCRSHEALAGADAPAAR